MLFGPGTQSVFPTVRFNQSTLRISSEYGFLTHNRFRIRTTHLLKGAHRQSFWICRVTRGCFLDDVDM